MTRHEIIADINTKIEKTIAAETGANIEAMVIGGDALSISGEPQEVAKARRVCNALPGWTFDDTDIDPEDPDYIVDMYRRDN